MPGRIGMKPSGSTASLLIGCLLLCCSQHCRRVEAYPQFAAEIPNALAVPHPTTPGIRCSALGHEDCVPGSKSLNSFGRAFQAAGFKWTPSLCAEDSDGDLLSNGEELGDPCCLWVKDENTVLDFAETSQLSHPGYAESALTAEQREVLATYDCSALAQEQKGDHRDMFYLAGEERMNVTLRFSANIPVRETSYLRYTYNLPAQPAVNYLVGFESIIEAFGSYKLWLWHGCSNEDHMHHYVVTACRKPFPAEFDGVMSEECLSRDCPEGYRHLQFEFECTDIFYLWAPGLDRYAFPNNTAFTLGPGVGYHGVYVQIHYDNRALLSNRTDSSALVFYTIPEQREHNVSFLALGPQLLHFQEIPAGQESYYFSGRCLMSVDKDVAPEGVTLLDFAPHMHRHGRRLWTEVLGKSDGTSIEPTQFADKQSLPFRKIGHIDNFDADLNFIWPLTHQERLHKLKTGDLLATTCIFNTAGETLPVSGGFGSYDEMCINFVLFYPAEAIPLKTCLNDSKEYYPPFHGTWGKELSQFNSSVLELTELASVLMSPNQELFGEIGYPTNDLSAIGKDDAGQAFPEDSLTDVPVTVGIPEGQKLQATGSTGAVDDSYARRWTYNTILVSAAMCSAIAYIVTLSH